MSSTVAAGYQSDTRDAVLTPSLIKRRSHRQRRLGSLLLTVLLPVMASAVYFYGFAADQYISEFRFGVRQQAPLRIDPVPGPTTALAGNSPILAVMTDSQMVVQYLKSRQIIDDLTAAGIDLDAIYAGDGGDFLARMQAGDSVEKRLLYWKRMVDPFFDMTTGIVSVEVRAFSPASARLVAAKALELSEKLVNGLSNRAHDDLVLFAQQEAERSEARLKAAQTAIAAYRDRHAVLFPEMQASADTSVEGQVQAALIEAKAAYASQMARGVAKDASSARILSDRIAALEIGLRDMHGRLARPDRASGTESTLASILSGYSALRLEEDIAAKMYERSLISLQDAHNAANQQSVYLAAFVRPGLPQDSMYPVRWRVMLEIALLAFVAWCLAQLMYHGIRDHID